MLVLALIVLAAFAFAADVIAEDPPALVLDHQEIVARARSGGLRDASLTYPDDRAVLRGRVRYLGLWWPIRVEAVFVREGARVRMRALELFVRGRAMPARRGDADARIARLVDEESAAVRVEIRDGGRVVYVQGVE